jgi:hypothetical protein
MVGNKILFTDPHFNGFAKCVSSPPHANNEAALEFLKN